ncbi:GNAT family N-acetyltransferase [Paenibacillus sp. MER 180]|uniref:GNAT family N-acetyltransferase n=1 Tax=unclassified Paenibacillus TaxID=185978 RepID=UPI000806555D|nr:MULTISPECIES: GNAT family N-acetyltransferase [unclassified Paenibacillus]MCM3290315.1 GNAT family N-acetyltransferase [Paenibacillus sp. MER 180]OBY81163.1 GCN5 family acetyltransferase [Paenibacillus sp. KS1]
MIRLRRPALDDEAIIQLVKRELLPHSHLIASHEQLLKEIPERLKVGPTYVAVDRHNRTIGFVHVYVREGTLIIDMLAVAQDSQHRGIGRQLMRKAEQYGKYKRCSQARMMVDYGNVRAERFYERRGYRFIRFVPAVVCHEMGKKL